MSHKRRIPDSYLEAKILWILSTQYVLPVIGARPDAISASEMICVFLGVEGCVAKDVIGEKKRDAISRASAQLLHSSARSEAGTGLDCSSVARWKCDNPCSAIVAAIKYKRAPVQ